MYYHLNGDPVEIEPFSSSYRYTLFESFYYRSTSGGGYFWSRWPFLVRRACVCARSTQFYIWFETKNVNFYVSTGMLDTHKTLSVFPIRFDALALWLSEFQIFGNLKNHYFPSFSMTSAARLSFFRETKFWMAGTGSDAKNYIGRVWNGHSIFGPNKLPIVLHIRKNGKN